MGQKRSDKSWRTVATRALRVALLLWSGPAFAAEGTGPSPGSGESAIPLSAALSFETKALPLTRQDAAYLALLNSRDLRIERLNPKITDTDIGKERGVFDPLFYSAAGTGHSTNASGNVLAGSSTPEVDIVNWSSGLRAKLVSGAVASLDFTNSRVSANSQFLTLNPQYSSNLVLTLTQPLLKDFGPQINRARVKLADNNAAISRYQLQGKVASVLADVESTYWELVLGLKDQDIRRRSLDLTQRLAERTRDLVREGFLAETSTLQADAAVAQRESDLEQANNTLRDTLSRLQDILNLDPKADVQIIPVDQPTLDGPKIDPDRAVKDALARRPELPQAKLDLKNRNLNLDIAKNQVLPRLDLFFSYGFAGLAGDAKVSTNPFLQSVLVQSQTPPSSLVGGYGTSLDNLFSGNFPSWTVGLNLSVPLGNVTAQSQVRKATLELERAILTVKDVERKIALEVERAARQIQTLKKAIDAARTAREHTSRRLEVTKEQFDLGLGPMSATLEAERDLVTAEREEWRTIVEYNKVLVQFDKATGATVEKYRVEF
jgi:HAE1 family hydrophobic/amphiphilic exporter-1